MQTIFLSLFILLVFCLPGQSQSCLPNIIVFNTQAEIDNFSDNYPGCTIVEGVVQIAGADDINNLNGLAVLTSIGNLIIQLNPSLTTLTGLGNLTTITGDIHIESNPVLTNLSGLESLSSVGGDFVIAENPQLTTLTALTGLSGVGGNLIFFHNGALPNLVGLEGLSTIGGSLEIGHNPALVNLTGLDNLHSVGGNVTINYNNALTALYGLGNLAVVGTGFSIYSNPVLSDLNGLASLHTISEGLFFISNNAELVGMYGLSSLSVLGASLVIEDNPFLPELSGLEGIVSIEGDLVLDNNANLMSLQGLENLGTLGGRLFINITSLQDLSGLDNLSTVGDEFWIGNNPLLTSLNGLQNLISIGGYTAISYNEALINLNGLANLTTVSDDLWITDNPALATLGNLDNLGLIEGGLFISNNLSLMNLGSLSSLSTIGNFLSVKDNPGLTNLGGLEALSTIDSSFVIANNDQLSTLDGLDNLLSVGTDISIRENESLISLGSLTNLSSVGRDLFILSNPSLTSLSGLDNIAAVGGNCSIRANAALMNLSGLNNLASIFGYLWIGENTTMTSLTGLENLSTIGSAFDVFDCPQLTSLTGLNGLSTVEGAFYIERNASLTSLAGLEQLSSVGDILAIDGNDALTSLNGLENIQSPLYILWIRHNDVLADISALANIPMVEGGEIFNNPSLMDCAIYAVCNNLLNQSSLISIEYNAPGCNSAEEVKSMCNEIPVLVEVRMDVDNNCVADSTDTLVPDVQVRLDATTQMILKETEANGQVRFSYLDNGVFSLHLPQFPTDHWVVCQDTVWLNPDEFPDTIQTTILLSPLDQCPEISVELGLPPAFRGCLVDSEVEVLIKNTGTVTAENVQIAVLIPPGLEVLSSTLPIIGQEGDTLYFEIGDLPSFASSTIQMTVKTSCEAFLFEQTLCLEAFASLENPCPNNLPPFSEIKLSATCMDDTLVRFTLKNIGEAPTQNLHEYTLIRNEEILNVTSFNLDAQQSITVDVPADGATYRLEATKFADGTLTALAIENCGGLTPGLITAFWLDEGPIEYDFDCRQVIGAFDPNQKTAIPGGVGPAHLLAANRPIQYTIDFQNTGTDTAFRVLLQDILPSHLDINTFRPVFASHPYTWEIRSSNLLEVLFFPIALPDSNVNEPASHGFFTFEIEQLPDLADGILIENTASIIFDFNPAIITNTVQHTIGELLIVEVAEPQTYPTKWQVLGNPTHDLAVFKSSAPIPGAKRFELYDAGGRLVRSAQFNGSQFEFRRNWLAEGLYFFRIVDEQGHAVTGKIVVSD